MILCGVEEAGRGPVIGPMVMAGITIDENDQDALIQLGVKDSKMLSPSRREELYPKILKIAKKYRIIVLSPQEIDSALCTEGMNLNWLEGLTSAKIINGLSPDKAVLDCPSTNVGAYTDYVMKRVDREVTIVAEHKADINHAVVAGASIIAKVTRDREIEDIKKKHGIEFGSGYPSDPKTREFLEKNYQNYDFFRKSWRSYTRLVESEGQKGLGSFS